MQCEFTNELRNHREEIQIICNHIAVEIRPYFLFRPGSIQSAVGRVSERLFVLSPMLVTLYLLSALPTLFFVLKIRSSPMRAIVLIVLFFVMVISIVSSLSCRRLLPMLTFVVTAIEMMYFGIVDNSSGKDKLLTKICVWVLTAFIAVLLFFSYNFVYKPEAPYLSNGRDTLWDTQTEELADEICSGCETDEEKALAKLKEAIKDLI